MCYSELKNKEVTVRKVHLCSWCGEEIYPGERAQSRAYKMDGDFTSDHMHPECYEASGIVGSEEGGCWTWNPGEYERGGTEPA